MGEGRMRGGFIGLSFPVIIKVDSIHYIKKTFYQSVKSFFVFPLYFTFSIYSSLTESFCSLLIQRGHHSDCIHTYAIRFCTSVRMLNKEKLYIRSKPFQPTLWICLSLRAIPFELLQERSSTAQKKKLLFKFYLFKRKLFPFSLTHRARASLSRTMKPLIRIIKTTFVGPI